METGNIAPVASMVEVGGYTQAKLPEAQPAAKETEIRNPGAQYIRLTQTKLVIEADMNGGGWVYKTVDAQNGDTLAQYPLLSVWEIILSQRSGVGLGLMVDAKA